MSKSYYFNNKFLQGLTIIWIGSSFGIPMITGKYINWLGTTFGNITTKNNILINIETDDIILPKTSFEKCVYNSDNYGLLVIFGPLSIPISLFYGIYSTCCLLIDKALKKNENT
jgi:hypothetical protein